MNNLLGEYTNGNYQVLIYNDGTKIRETEDNEFVSEYPECIDLKITNQCELSCPWCHENSTKDGLHGDILQANFINTLLPYTELAIGGGNPLSHPDLVPFLIELQKKNIIANITVNQKHFIENNMLLKILTDNKLIYGLGVSLTKITNELIDNLKFFPNAVLHVINGVVNLDELQKIYGLDYKLLILGYKQFRRGLNFYSDTVSQNQVILYKELPNIISKFKVVSFDNLAINQLNVKRLMSNKDWNEFYMGDDGQFTMYIDLVNKIFARSSVSKQRYQLLDDIKTMFDVIKSE